MVGSDSVVGSPADFEFVVGFDSALGMLAGSEPVHSTTKECFQPTTLQSTEGNFQHYAHWPHSMYIVHEDTPFDSAQIIHRYNTGLILNLVLLLG